MIGKNLEEISLEAPEEIFLIKLLKKFQNKWWEELLWIFYQIGGDVL